MTYNEDQAAARDGDLKMRADVVFEALMLQDRTYERHGRKLSAGVAMQSEPLVTALLKTGLFATNIQSMVTLARGTDIPTGKVEFDQVPSFLLGMGAHYAVTVAPKMSGSADGAVVDVEALIVSTEKLEEVMGDIPVDKRLVEEVCKAARLRLQVEGPASLSAGD